MQESVPEIMQQPMQQPIQRFAANPRGRDFVVGDIHGCFYMLDALLERLTFDRDEDRLFSVGDLIDRGPDSERAVEYLEAPWFHTIRGNHEQMLLDAVVEGGQARRLWQMNGGDWFQGLDRDSADHLIERVAELPYAIEVELGDGQCAGLVHGQMPRMDWAQLRTALQAERLDAELTATMLWARDSAGEIMRRASGTRPFVSIEVPGVDVIFFGHTPMRQATASANTRWLDTGAFMGRTLSVAELAVEGRVWSLGTDPGDLREGWAWLDGSGATNA